MSQTTVVPAAAVLACLVWSGCSPSQPSEATEGEATLLVIADVSAAVMVATVVVEVTAPDIATPMVFNLPIVAGTASSTITVPAGPQRTITMRAFSDLGIETHSGSVTIDVTAGITTTVIMTINPLTGDLDIIVTMGTISITISPATHAFIVGATVDLTATITTTTTGGPASAQVSWATLDPGVARVVVVDAVNNIGRVTAEGLGTTDIIATFGGAGGSATVTVN